MQTRSDSVENSLAKIVMNDPQKPLSPINREFTNNSSAMRKT